MKYQNHNPTEIQKFLSLANKNDPYEGNKKLWKITLTGVLRNIEKN